jgi:hypothetical protein
VREAYAEYRKIKEDMQDFLIAKRNIDMFLGKESERRDAMRFCDEMRNTLGMSAIVVEM